MLQNIIDVIILLSISFSMTFLFIKNYIYFWFLFLIVSIKIYKTGYTSKTSRIFSLFKAIKVVSLVISIIIVNYGQNNKVSDNIIKFCLGLNILEAVLLDCLLTATLQVDCFVETDSLSYIQSIVGIPNAISGLLLILKLCNELIEHKTIDGYFSFQLSSSWIIGYSLWNLAFVYNFLSLSFGLILMVPYILSFHILCTPDIWLSARAYSLVINQSFRGLQYPYIFIPDGKSIITDPEGIIIRNQKIRFILGILNLIIILFVLG